MELQYRNEIETETEKKMGKTENQKKNRLQRESERSLPIINSK